MKNLFVIEKNQLKLISDLGISQELLVKKLDLPDVFQDDDALAVTIDQYTEIMNYMSDVSSDDVIIDFADIDKHMMFVPSLFASMCAKNGLEALKRLSHYKRLVGPYRLNISESDDILSAVLVYDDNKTVVPYFTIFMELTLFVGLIRKATCLDVVPLEIESIYECRSDAFEKYFKIKPKKGIECKISFRMEDLKEPFLTSNNTMWRYLEPELNKRLRELSNSTSISSSVRDTLLLSIPAGNGTIEKVSHSLNMSVRTLQRKLKEEGTSFIKELNRTRLLLSEHYLLDQNMRDEDVAFLVGYSDCQSFKRAFKSWTDLSVSEYRDLYVKKRTTEI
jgi:AraC-like DNA-binding protein